MGVLTEGLEVWKVLPEGLELWKVLPEGLEVWGFYLRDWRCGRFSLRACGTLVRLLF